MNSFKIYLNIITIIVLLTACETFKNDVPESDNFQKIYTVSDGDAELYTLDVIELKSGEYLILSAIVDSLTSVYPRVHILKTFENGETEWFTVANSPYNGPARGFIEINDEYFVLCMKENQSGCILKVDLEQQTLTEVKALNFTFPLYTSQFNNSDFIIIGYDRIGNQSVIQALDANLSIVWEQSYSIGSAITIMEQNIFAFINQTKDYPFFGEKVAYGGNDYYLVNCFDNFTLSMHFLDAASGNQTGKINGYQLTGYISTVKQISDTAIFMAYTHSGKVYIPTLQSLNFNGVAHINDLNGVYYPEIDGLSFLESFVTEQQITPNKFYLAINNNNGEPGLFDFTTSPFQITQTRNLPQYYPSLIKAVYPTQDGGVVLLLQVDYANYLPRASLIKLPKSFLDEER